MWSAGCVFAELMLGQVGVNGDAIKVHGCRQLIITLAAFKLFSLNCVFQPIFPGDSGVDQLVEIIKVCIFFPSS